MATEPPPFLTFRASADKAAPTTGVTPSAMEQPVDRIPVYGLALELSRVLFTVIELTEGVERYYLRDTLDKKSTAIPMLVKRGLSMADMSGRRAVFREARERAADCTALVDVLAQRGTVEDEVIAEARAATRAFLDHLEPLCTEPKRY